MCCVPNSYAAQILISGYGYTVLADDDYQCGAVLNVISLADSKPMFSGDRINLQRVLAGYASTLGATCPQARKVLVHGQVNGIVAFEGKMLKSNGWRLDEASMPTSLKWSQLNPYVLTIDGVDLWMQTPFHAIPIEWIPYLDRTGRGESYIAPIIEQNWEFAIDVRPFLWSGNIDDTNQLIGSAKQQISSLAESARRNKRAFVIVAHSWGTVIAYRAIWELYLEGKIGKDSIDVLVTMGSPLSKQATIANIAVKVSTKFQSHEDLARGM